MRYELNIWSYAMVLICKRCHECDLEIVAGYKFEGSKHKIKNKYNFISMNINHQLILRSLPIVGNPDNPSHFQVVDLT